jgi:carbamoyl-phosphate synthase large subunit
MDKIGLESPRSAIAHSLDEAIKALETTGLRRSSAPAFTLGGTGGGIAYNREEFLEIVSGGLEASPDHRSADRGIGARLEGIRDGGGRDRADNAIIICSIENVDPMGVHTGDSITVAPALTLTDKEYQIMRNASIACCARSASKRAGPTSSSPSTRPTGGSSSSR